MAEYFEREEAIKHPKNILHERALQVLHQLRCKNGFGGIIMDKEPTYMDCWHFIAPLIPVDNGFTMDVYVMVFEALKEAEERRLKKERGRNNDD